MDWVGRRWGRATRWGRRGVGAGWRQPAPRAPRATAVVALLAVIGLLPATATERPLTKLAATAAAGESTRVPMAVGARSGGADVVAAAPAVAMRPSSPPPARTGTESVIEPPPETFDAPASRPAPPPSILTTQSSGGSGGVWAVVIGIDDYPGSRSDLRASVSDANVVDYTLASYGVPADRRLVLRNTQASAAVIQQSLRWLVANAGDAATAVFFYAGHVRKPRGGGEAIVAADGGLVYDRTVADLLRPLRARHTWIVIAACYGAGFDEALAPNRILTAAAGRHSLAYENAAYRNSYLVEYQFERAMMQGRAPDSVEQAYAWAYKALARDHPNRMPEQYDYVAGEVVIGTPPQAPQSSPPPTQPPGPGQPPPTTPPPSDDDDDNNGCLLTLGNIANCDPD